MSAMTIHCGCVCAINSLSFKTAQSLLTKLNLMVHDNYITVINGKHFMNKIIHLYSSLYLLHLTIYDS